jgi:hypothetical protein
LRRSFSIRQPVVTLAGCAQGSAPTGTARSGLPSARAAAVQGLPGFAREVYIEVAGAPTGAAEYFASCAWVIYPECHDRGEVVMDTRCAAAKARARQDHAAHTRPHPANRRGSRRIREVDANC